MLLEDHGKKVTNDVNYGFDNCQTATAIWKISILHRYVVTLQGCSLTGVTFEATNYVRLTLHTEHDLELPW